MDNDLQALKKKIYEDDNVSYLLDELGCEHVHTEQHGNLIVAQLPDEFDSSNRRSIQIKNNESLTANIRSRSISGDIFSVIGFIQHKAETFNDLKEYLYPIKVWICNTLEYDDFLDHHGSDFSEEVQANGWLKDIKKKRKIAAQEMGIVSHKNTVIPSSILGEYMQLPSYHFYQDGININTQWEFGVGFDMSTQRITFPIHNQDGELIGVKGRYIGSDEYVTAHMKYIYLHKCDKSLELFNLHRAVEHIRKLGEVIIVEGAKTCMTLSQWKCRNCVSIEGNSLTPVQARLLRELGVNIVFAWDKDIDMKHIQKNIQQIKNRPVYALFDTKNLLEDHESPVDKGKKVWDDLYMNCMIKV